MVTASILDKESGVVAGRAERAIGNVHGRKNAVRRASWILDTETPRAVTLAAGGVTVKIVPGAHESILEEPHVRVVAEELKKSLEAP